MRPCAISRVPVSGEEGPAGQAPADFVVDAAAGPHLSRKDHVGAHKNWLMAQKLEHREQRMALEELLQGVRQESERIERLVQTIREAVPEWSLAEVVTALQAMRGID